MPKYLNPPEILQLLAINLKSFVDMEDKEVTKYMCKLFDGILDDATIRRYMKKEFKSK